MNGKLVSEVELLLEPRRSDVGGRSLKGYLHCWAKCPPQAYDDDAHSGSVTPLVGETIDWPTENGENNMSGGVGKGELHGRAGG